MAKDIRLTIRIDDKTHLDLMNMAAMTDRTVSWLIRFAIKKYIKFSKRKDSRL